jgi:N4-gp56 family major capsid protein
MYSRQLSNVLRMAVQPLVKFRQFCDVRDASQQGRKKGDTFTWDVFSDVVNPGAVLTETNTMPETNFTIVQGTLTITEAGNSVPYSGKLDNLSKFPVVELIQKVLKNDAVKTFDRLAWTQFNQTPLRAVSTDTNTTGIIGVSGTYVFNTNGTATITNSVALSNNHLKNIVDTMKERNIPAYIGDDYYALAWPTTLRTLKNNLETIHQYSDTGFKLIMNGEIGRYENVRFIEQTNIVKGISTDGINGTGWTNNKSDWIFFFGNDTVAEAIAVPEEMRGKIPSDYGRSKGVAWYYLGGFGIVHTLAQNARIVKWDSAV